MTQKVGINYLTEANVFGWAPGILKINSDKASFLKKYAVGNCLDIGFGSGLYTNYLHQLGHATVGIDAEHEFVKKARLAYPQIKFVLGSCLRLPFKNKEFDTAVIFDVLEHVDDAEVLTEIRRVARRIIITVPHRNQNLLLRYALAHAHSLSRSHLRNYSAPSLRRVLIKTGWKVKVVKTVMPISLSGLLITRLSQNNQLKRLALKFMLKPFLPEPPLFSTVLAVADSPDILSNGLS